MIARGLVRLAFTYIPRSLSAGAYNYQTNLFAALHRHRRGEFAPVVFASESDNDHDLTELAAIPGVSVVKANAFARRSAGLTSALLLGTDNAVAAEFNDQNIDVVVETARFFGWRLPFPAVAWFTDFQHRRLPELFSPAARWRREIGFRAQIAGKRTIMLSSESALRDYQTYYPTVANQVSVVRFASQPSAALLTVNSKEIAEHYKLPEHFFYLPNQFWRHKNHQVVIDALTMLAARGVDVVIAASGSNNDPREPNYFNAIMRQVADRNLSRNFRYLGMIPQSHVYALLRVSAALINPSRFEGWSTPVEEAKSFGVPMILSDLDVHREQAEGSARYFGVDNPAALAEHLLDAAREFPPSFARNFVPDLDGRASRFAGDFASTIRIALESWRGRSDRS